MEINRICEYGKNIPEEQKTCPHCGVDLTPLHNLKALPRFYYEEGIKLARQRLWSIAIDKFKIAISLDPRLIEAYLALGNVYLQNGYCDHAIAEYEKALKFEPANEDIKEAKMRTEKLGTSREPKAQLKETATKPPESKKQKKFGFVEKLSKSASKSRK